MDSNLSTPPTTPPAAPTTAVLMLNVESEAPQLFPFAGGTAAAYAKRCPGKETPNEDSLGAWATSATTGVLAIADGVGGERCGDRASRTAIEAIQAALRDSPPNESGDARPAVLNGIERANHEVMELGVGAASTLALVEISGDTIRPYHVGDSMMMLVGNRGKVKWQTVPHSPVGYAVEAGVLDEDDAIHHADRHLVSNIVGTDNMRIEIGPRLKMAPRDTLVVASDGLFDNLHTSEIIEIVRKGPLKKAIVKLAALVTERMEGEAAPSKPDDTSLLMFRLR